MPKISVALPRYRLHKGTGQNFVQVTGCRQYLGKFGAEESQEGYRRFVAELCVSPAPPVLDAPRRIRLCRS